MKTIGSFGQSGSGSVAHTALTSTSARALTELLVCPAELDPEGVVGCTEHPTSPTLAATTSVTSFIVPVRD
ncbi:hypothetical protein [Mycobacteroides immunogenum]|uniref:hypothetical protein n=1 Tax=Mycobacteroides immunogenum TaxID=83262 RepID=UPI001040A5AE|nr:hypothetical protein [Mycobacteroides immunogenum]MCV7303715.1 hypothetical protein [Mycobacteroides immunogenum]